MNHNDLELPMGKRTLLYRLFEILPAFLSYGMLILFIILSLINPLWASIYLLVLVMSVIVRSIGIAYRSSHYRNGISASSTPKSIARISALWRPTQQASRDHRSFTKQ